MIAVRLCGVLGDTQTDRLRRLGSSARAARLAGPRGLPCTPKCDSWGAAYTTNVSSQSFKSSLPANLTYLDHFERLCQSN